MIISALISYSFLPQTRMFRKQSLSQSRFAGDVTNSLYAARAGKGKLETNVYTQTDGFTEWPCGVRM